MYNHIPFNERKQNTQKFQTILLNHKKFLNINENEFEHRNNARILSTANFRIHSPKRKLTSFDALDKMKNDNSINKIVESQENDFNNFDEEEKENFLKKRGRKLKDYLSGFLNKSENLNTNEEEEENQIQLFSLDHILENTEEKSKDPNKLFDFQSKYLRDLPNEKRSRTSGPAHFNFGKYKNNTNDSYLIHKFELDKINQELNKNRKKTISYNNEHIKSKRKHSFNAMLESYLSVPKIERKKKTTIYQVFQSNREKTIKFNSDSKIILNEIPKERSSKHSNSINRKSTNSIKEKINDDKKVLRRESNYLTYLNKKLSGNKLAFKNLLNVDKEEEKKPVKQINQNKRNFIKFQNVYDSLSDDENEDYSSCLIFPENKFKEFWDYLILAITIYTLLYVPYDMAFINSNSGFIIILDLICDLIYMLDVLLQFLTPINTTEDKYITSYYLIAKNYFFSWFLLDVTSSIPFNSIITIINANYKDSNVSNTTNIGDKITNIAKLSRVYRMMRLIRLLKLIKIAKSDKYKTKNLNIFRNYHVSNINRLFLFLLYFIILNHMLACIWTFVASLDYPNWISNKNMLDSSNLDLYIASIYFNLTTIFTIGYGDVTSINNYERLYNIIIMCVGIMLYTFAVSSLSNLIQKRDEKTLKFEKNINFLDDVSNKFNLNFKLYSKIRRCLKYDYSVNTEDKFNMLSNLPEIIKIELINQMHKEMINNFFFFKNTNPAFRAKILILLKPLKAIRGDILLKENEFVEEMFFLKKGILNVCKNYRGQPLKLIEIRKNEHFGEIFMLLHEKSLYDLVVKSKYAELFFMRKVDLLEVYAEYQSIFESILQKSTYNSLIILKRFKNMLRNIKKRKSGGKTKTENINYDRPRKSMFLKFLNKDEEKIERNKNKRNSIFSTKESPQKQNFLDENTALVNENPNMFLPNSNNFQQDFPVIMEHEEENEDEYKNNSLKFNCNNKVSNVNEISIIKKKKNELDSSESGSVRKTKNSHHLDINCSSQIAPNANSLRSTTIRKSIADKLNISILPMKNRNDTLNEMRDDKRRFTSLANPSKTMNFSRINEIKCNLDNQIKKPLIAKRNHINSSLNFQIKDKTIRRNTLFIHNEINKNIINDSLNIKAPAMFYSNKFEKWTLLCQIRKLDNVFLKFQQG